MAGPFGRWAWRWDARRTGVHRLAEQLFAQALPAVMALHFPARMGIQPPWHSRIFAPSEKDAYG